MFCEDCGSALPPAARYCTDCGSPANRGQTTVHSCQHCQTVMAQEATYCNKCGVPVPITFSPDSPVSQDAILAELRRYSQHVDLTCLECGYRGLMGVVKSHRPSYAPYALMNLGTSGIGGTLAYQNACLTGTRHTVVCPACRRLLRN